MSKGLTLQAQAEPQQGSVGEVVCRLARQALAPAKGQPGLRNGIPLLRVKPGVAAVTPEWVNRLRGELP